ncbi:MAG: Ppx/GppA phosphatase family protein [Thermodesulfobacteriota bacterium]|nr:Ppx/GppA phosphatase family protein [Thermodesulfobacteriota bacterium]
MAFPRYASIDVGSNTARLLLAEKTAGGDLHPLRVERRITRLGGNFSGEGKLDEGAALRTIAALQSFADVLREERVETVFAVATGVVRAAKDGEEFIKQVFKLTGLSINIISGEEEARLMLRGVLCSLKGMAPSWLVVDVGGWSTEIIWVRGNSPGATRSIPLGAVALREGFLKSDPPKEDELELLKIHTRKVLGELRQEFERGGLKLDRLHPDLVGTAGTMTTLAAIDQRLLLYDPLKINGHQISRQSLKKIYLTLSTIPARERLNFPGLEKGREDLIVPGVAVVLSLLDVFKLKRVLVVDSGVLEGVLLQEISRFP